jgi:RNA methyltransferase, TrmH family
MMTLFIKTVTFHLILLCAQVHLVEMFQMKSSRTFGPLLSTLCHSSKPFPLNRAIFAYTLRHFSKSSSWQPYDENSISASSSYTYSIITSTKSQTVKKIQALLTKRKKRLELGQTVIEGPRMVFDLIQNCKTVSLIRQVVVSVHEFDAREDYRRNLEVALKQNRDHLLVQLATPEVFPACTDTMTPQGIVAIVDIPNYNDVDTGTPKDSLHSANQRPQFHLVLDGVSDPGNLGSLLRSSLAVGVASILLLPGCCDVWNPKAVRSAMGASFQVPIRQCDSWDAGQTILQELGVKTVYAATMMEDDESDNVNDTDRSSPHGESQQPQSIPYYDVDWTQDCTALVIGSEGNGLSTDLRRLLMARDGKMEGAGGGCIDLRATHIPMQYGIESLNAAVCGSVILFEFSRQCAMNTSGSSGARSVGGGCHDLPDRSS